MKFQTPWRDGTTPRAISPLEFMQRLAALLPPPQLQLIRLHGVLVPNAKLRAMVVPKGPPDREQPATEADSVAECEVETAQVRPHRIGWARLLERVFSCELTVA